MSSSRVRQGPSPPTVEQILEDLSAASDEDVVFKSPVVVEHGNQTNNASSHSKEENALQQTVSGRDETEDKANTEENKTNDQSNEKVYGKVASFLEQFKSLESAKEHLYSQEADLKSKKEGLEKAVGRVKEAWKVNNSDS